MKNNMVIVDWLLQHASIVLFIWWGTCIFLSLSLSAFWFSVVVLRLVKSALLNKWLGILSIIGCWVGAALAFVIALFK